MATSSAPANVLAYATFGIQQEAQPMIIEAKALPAPQPAAPVQTTVMPPAQPEVTPEFTFKDQKVRVVMIEGAPWFVGMDVTKFLGIDRVDNLLRKISADQKQLCPHSLRGNLGLHHKAILISESGLFKLVMRSDKPEAKTFQDWMTRDVLPSIRKSGAYSVGDETPVAAAPVVPATPAQIEAQFIAVLEHRRDQNIQRAQQMRYELAALERVIFHDCQVLDHLAAISAAA